MTQCDRIEIAGEASAGDPAPDEREAGMGGERIGARSHDLEASHLRNPLM